MTEENMNNFQRVGSVSNAHVGSEFEEQALFYFKSKNIILNKSFILPIGIGSYKKDHVFDLGCNSSKHGKIIENTNHIPDIYGNVPS